MNGHPAYDRDCPAYKAEELRRERAKEVAILNKIQKANGQQRNGKQQRRQPRVPTMEDFAVNGMAKRTTRFVQQACTPTQYRNNNVPYKSVVEAGPENVSNPIWETINGISGEHFNRTTRELMQLCHEWSIMVREIKDPAELRCKHIQKSGCDSTGAGR